MSHYLNPRDGALIVTVYDLIAMRRTNRIVAHDDDINGCCWADTSSGNVLISASDDSFLKVWYVFTDTVLVMHSHRMQG